MIGEELLYDLRSFLFHLYDPAYPPGDPVRTLTGCPAEGDAACSRAAVLDAIESLRPPPDVPVSSRLSRLYQLLLHRFVQSRTQEETSGLLGLTPRQPPFSPPLLPGRQLAIEALREWINGQQPRRPQAEDSVAATRPADPATPHC